MDERARRVFRSFMVGSAVAATLATLEAANHPVLAATGLSTTPSVEESGTSPAVTLSWTTALSPSDTITVNIGGFSTTANPGNCLSSGISMRIGSSPVDVLSCNWDQGSRQFTLRSVGNAVGMTSLTFPSGVLVAGAPGTTQLSVNDDLVNPTIKAYASMTITPTAGPSPPDWFQSYQRGSAVEPCATTWNPSWAMWANNGTGGFVCVRTTYFDPRLAAWSYR